MPRIVLILGFLLRGAAATADAERLDPRSLELFFDSIVSEEMERYGIPGMVVAIVDHGEVRLAKGYGLADLETRTPVSAEDTLFSVASVTKVVTATAVMKLLQSGRLRLDEDVNRYLTRFQVEGEPLTLAHLLTHTAGFDAHYTSQIAPGEGPVPPLDAYFSSEQPARLAPPGERVAYSNHGIGLAAAIVEEVTGAPFARFVEREIFAPLGMTKSSIGTETPRGNLATGYAFREGSYRPVKRDYLRLVLVPAAGLHATGADMARFLVGLLEEVPGFLDSSTLREMYRRRYTLHPDAAGVTYGFREHFENGRRALVQDGDWDGFSSRLVLLPEEGVGLFVSANAWRYEARAEMLSAFLDRYYPNDAATRSTERRELGDMARLAGTYWSDRYPERGVLKLAKLFARVKVDVTRKGELRVSTSGRFPNFFQYPELRFAPAGPLLFERLDGEGTLAFREESDGQVAMQLDVPEIKTTGLILFHRAPWYALPVVQLSAAGVVLSLVLSGVAWPLLELVRIVRRRPLAPGGHGRRARILGGLVALLAIAFILTIGPAVRTIGTFGAHYALALSLSLPIGIAALVPGLVFFSWTSWRRRLGSLFARVHYSLFTLATVGLLFLLHFWNLMGFRY